MIAQRIDEIKKEQTILLGLLDALQKERDELEAKLWDAHQKTLPYIPSFSQRMIGEKKRIDGLCYRGKYKTAVYWNDKEKTYYTAPLYDESGNVLGYQTSKRHILEIIQKLEQKGFKNVTRESA